MVDHGRMLYFLDGAHTEESVLACRSWFTVASRLVSLRQPAARRFRIMIFNITADRDPRILLQPFLR
jgi:folylpolyglutamate synthase/dihydropteroate synthase